MQSKSQNPFRLFDEGYYLRTYPDVGDAGIDPYRHFLKYGIKEKRNPCAVFNTEYYLSQVSCWRGDPSEHYQTIGYKLKAEPHPSFDRQWYLRNYPDVARSGIEPLWHYLRYGQAEGRKSGPLWRAHFSDARKPIWQLREAARIPQALGIRFQPDDHIEAGEAHSCFGFALFLTATEITRFVGQRNSYVSVGRAEPQLIPTVIVVLSDARVVLDPACGFSARFGSGSIFSLGQDECALLSELGGGVVRIRANETEWERKMLQL